MPTRHDTRHGEDVHAEIREVAEEKPNQRGVQEGSEEIDMGQYHGGAGQCLQQDEHDGNHCPAPQIRPAWQAQCPDQEHGDGRNQHQGGGAVQQIDGDQTGEVRHPR